jgi:MoaA/NifB/PqqE/SkfB family radical SAM enzyme
MDRFRSIQELIRGRKHHSIIPRELLIDPTSACHLKCKGCWAADYSRTDNLSFEIMDDILTQSEALGIRNVAMSGGEPLMRKDDIIRLCDAHRKTTFGIFTNGVLIDDSFADEIARVENMGMYISIEGNREETDFRRGAGVYDKVIQSMERLRRRNIAFAFSSCYHSRNYKTVASDAFLDDMRQRGAWFGWLFNYVPVGKDADLSLVCTPEQRAYVMEHVKNYSERNDFTIIDFWNMGHSACGCIAAGSGYLHINARGDVEPCAFCHYSDVNIHDVTLLEALKSPFLTRFRAAQPFTDNPLRSCPMIDSPDSIVKLVDEGGAHSTHYSAPESAKDFAAKTSVTAKEWKPVSEKLLPIIGLKRLAIFDSSIKFLNLKRKVSDFRRVKPPDESDRP